jgi:tetratricopeptide (TPR) repeat protein
MVGQTIEVPFRLTGWVYLGESASQRGIRYISRRLDTEGQTFIFQAGETGAYELKFYRQDFIRDYIINDLVTLIVEDAPIAAQSFGAPVDRGRVVAEPRWPSIAGEAIPGDDSPVSAGTPAVDPGIADDRNSRPSAPSGVVPGRAVPGQAVPTGGTASSAVPGQAAPVGTAILPEIAGDGSPSLFSPETSAEEYLRRAREEYDAGHIPQAIAVLDQFMARFPLGSDEALWLYGQMYEAPGSSRNIRSALDCYRRLINEYPQSNRYADARRRIAYLERYYINIQ